MKNALQQYQVYDEAIYNKQMELIEIQIDVLNFLDNKRRTKDISKYISSFKETEIEIEVQNLKAKIIAFKKVEVSFKEQADEMLKRTQKLEKTARKIRQDLKQDLTERTQSNSFDLVKVASFGVSCATGSVTLAKATMDPQNIHAAWEALSGLAAGIILGCMNKIGSAFKSASDIVCRSAHKINVSLFKKEATSKTTSTPAKQAPRKNMGQRRKKKYGRKQKTLTPN